MDTRELDTIYVDKTGLGTKCRQRPETGSGLLGGPIPVFKNLQIQLNNEPILKQNWVGPLGPHISEGTAGLSFNQCYQKWIKQLILLEKN